jgi:hypothetical protein
LEEITAELTELRTAKVDHLSRLALNDEKIGYLEKELEIKEK